jgi:hypothetical protein
MKHLVYHVSSIAKAPVGHGDQKSWFFHYKWGVDEESWLPFPERCLPEAGDLLWISIDHDLLGVVRVIRVAPDPLHDRVEVWYDSRKALLGEEVRLSPDCIVD